MNILDGTMGLCEDRMIGVEGIKCPGCGVSRWVVKYGKTRAGLQKYRCRDRECGRQFVAGSDHRLAAKTKDVVLKLLAADVPPRAIADAIRDISLRWIYELRRKGKR